MGRMRGFNAQAAVIAAAVLAALVATTSVLWSYPRVLLYVLLGLIAVMAYAALYLLVATAKAKDTGEPPDEGASPPGDAG